MSDRIKKYTPETFKAALEQQQEYNYYNRVNGQIEEVALEYEEKDRKQRETYQKCEQTKIDNKAKKEDLNNIRNVFQKELNAINKELEPLLEEYKMAESAMSVGYGDAFDRNYEKIKELSPKIKELESKKAILEPFIYSCDQQLKMSKYDYLNEDVNIVNYMNEYKKNGYNIFNIDWEKARDCDPSIDTKENPLNRLAVVEYLISTAPEDIDFENIKRNNPRIGGMLVNGEIIDYFDLYQFLTEEERAKYHYLFEHEGIDVATQYIIDMQDTFNQRQGQAEAEKFLNSLDYTDEGKLKQSISNYFGVSVEGLGDGIDSFWEGIDKIIMADGVLSSDDYRKIYVLQGLQEKSDILDGVYQFSSSLGNMAPTLVASAVITYCTKNPELGAKIASMLMGASAGGNAREQALVGGSDQTSAALYAIFTGLSEATLGYYLGKIPGISQTSGFTLSNILQEGTEEYLQTYIDAGLQAVILGSDIDWNEVPKEAQKSFIMGMLMSGFLNGGQAVVNVTINGVNKDINVEQILEYVENNNVSLEEAFYSVSGLESTIGSDVIHNFNEELTIEKVKDLESQNKTPEQIASILLDEAMTYKDDYTQRKYSEFVYEYLLASGVDKKVANQTLSTLLTDRVHSRGFSLITNVNGVNYYMINNFNNNGMNVTYSNIIEKINSFPKLVTNNTKNVFIYDVYNPGDFSNHIMNNYKLSGKYFEAAACCSQSNQDIFIYSPFLKTGETSLRYTLPHELAHSFDAGHKYSSSPAYLEAVYKDKMITGRDTVSDYGENGMHEDFADAYALYRNGELYSYPNRQTYFDNVIRVTSNLRLVDSQNLDRIKIHYEKRMPDYNFKDVLGQYILTGNPDVIPDGLGTKEFILQIDKAALMDYYNINLVN